VALDSPPLEDPAGRRAGALLNEALRKGESMTLKELIDALGGKLVQGSLEQTIDGISSYANAGVTDLVFAEDAASAAKTLTIPAAAVVLKSAALPSYAANPSLAVIESDQPRLWFARAAKLLTPAPPCERIHPTAVVGKNAALGSWVTVGANAVIGDDVVVGDHTRIEAGAVIGEGVRIGSHCRIYPRVVVYPGVYIGNRVVLHSGVVLGADGFGYVRDNATGAYTQFPQQGGLIIEDDVEIGANSTVDRGALGATRVGRGSKFDNLVHVAHNCEIGEDVILVALTGISGSSKIGNGAILAGQVGIGDHVTIGPGVILGGQAGVFSGKTLTNEGCKPGTVHWGTPARPLQQVLREQATLARLAKRQSPKRRVAKEPKESD
jgi:UDP-3-O-[3-hydroxymyristoyl] glucosamine N-acyltransferase